MKLSNDKCHLLRSGYKLEVIWAKICQIQIWKNKKQKPLGIIIDKDINLMNIF